PAEGAVLPLFLSSDPLDPLVLSKEVTWPPVLFVNQDQLLEACEVIGWKILVARSFYTQVRGVQGIDSTRAAQRALQVGSRASGLPGPCPRVVSARALRLPQIGLLLRPHFLYFPLLGLLLFLKAIAVVLNVESHLVGLASRPIRKGKQEA